MSTTKEKGDAFENKVAELYRLMGYEVKQNVGILGHQIDIILTYTQPGGIVTKTAVECKYKERGNLRKNDFIKNLEAYIDLRRNNIVQSIITITTNGFAKDIWDSSKANNIQLLTYHELEHRILNMDLYVERIINEYKSDEISNYYIEQSAQDAEKEYKEIYYPLNNYIDKWL